MDLVLILGPMKSGKSIDLISYFSSFQYTRRPFGLFQPQRNVREERIWSRNGIAMEAKKVPSLEDALHQDYSLIGVDEMHMFAEREADIVAELLRQGKRVIVSSLDTDYRGRMFDVVRRLLELGPKEVRYKRAVCDRCNTPEAIYTQVLRGEMPVTQGIAPSVPDDGTFNYQSVCRNCFATEARPFVRAVPSLMPEPAISTV